MNTKNLLLIILCIWPYHLIHTMELSRDQKHRIIKWVATVKIQHLTHNSRYTHYSKKLEEKTSLTLHDIRSTCTLATTLMAASYLFCSERQKKIQHFALHFPMASLLTKLITSKAVKQSTKQIPLLNLYLGCPNTECTGTCNSCTLRNMVVFAGVMRMLV